MKRVRWKMLIFACVTLAGIGTAWSQDTSPGSEIPLAEDLRAVIILAGYPCPNVGKVIRVKIDDYQVTCVPDRQYRVQVSEEQNIVVESLSDPPGVISRGDVSHEAFMKRKLFSVVNLAGHPCNSVLTYEYRGPRDSLVTCDDQTVYRIHVTPEGRVAVDRQTHAK